MISSLGMEEEGKSSKMCGWGYNILLILQVKALAQIIFRKQNVVPQGNMQLYYYICQKTIQVTTIHWEDEFSEAVMLRET